MKTIILLAVALTARATTYYVGTTGSDSNTPTQAQSAGTPWLTIQHSVSNLHCGDTLIVLSNGAYLQNSDATFPYFANCSETTTVQGQGLAMLAQAGWRTNPTTDSANYGKLQFSSQGWTFQNEVHGGWVVNANNISQGTFDSCNFSNISPMDGSAATTFTVSFCYGGLESLANGTQVELEVNGYQFTQTTTLPTPLNPYQIYYVTNCSTSPACNAGAGSNFQLAATPGGTPIRVTGCAAPLCLVGAVNFTQPLQVNLSTNTFTIPDAFVSCSVSPTICFSNGIPVTFNSIGLESFVPILPAPLQANTPYYIKNLSGSSFQVSATPGGPTLALTAIGTGPLTVATMQSPSQWAFRGLEFYYTGPNTIYGFLSLGSGVENSRFSIVSHMEVDRCYMHDNPADNFGLDRGIVDNGEFINIHDSYLAGMRNSEAQAIAGWQALGPTTITNNFLEGGGENTLYGGANNNTGLPNANHTFTGNYYYKPPLWKITSSTGPASGPCWYDATDPNHAGGEWYQDTSASQWYQCDSSSVWASVPYGPTFSAPTIKDMAEHKSGTHFTYSGNLFNYIWGQAQSGEFFNNSQEPGSGAGIANDHITVVNNKMLHGFQFVLTLEYCSSLPSQPCPTPPGAHSYVNNLMVADVNACGVQFATGTNPCGYQMYLTQSAGLGLQGYLFSHNTIWTGDTWSGLTTNGLPPRISYTGVGVGPGCATPASNYYVFQNSITSGDLQGDCYSKGAILANYFTNTTYTNFVTLNGSSNGYGAVGASNSFTNIAYPTSNTTISYVNSAGGDYHLSATSPYSAQNSSATLLSTDGTDLGADIDLLNMATSGAAAGTPSWDQQAGLRVTPGSTQTVFRYTAPTAAACTATVYGAAARIPANQLATSNDASTNSIANANARELYISGLQASTQYWYKLACGGGVLMVGNFSTRPTGRAALQFSFDWSTPTPMQYSSSRSMTSPVTLSPATRQWIPVAVNSVVYVQEGTGGPITMLIAP